MLFYKFDSLSAHCIFSIDGSLLYNAYFSPLAHLTGLYIHGLWFAFPFCIFTGCGSLAHTAYSVTMVRSLVLHILCS